MDIEMEIARVEEVAADSYAFAEFDIDGKPHPKLSEIAGKYLTGEISRKENQEQTMAAVRTLEQEKKEGKF